MNVDMSKARCQSCGMPLDPSFGNYGTEADGSPASEYCQFCYQDGGFTKPDQTVDEMIDGSTNFMTTEFNLPREKASQISNDVIRTLKRWQ